MPMIPGDAALGTGLAGELYNSAGGILVPGVEAQELCNWIAAAIIAHVTTNATVVPTLLVAPNGPVTGTGQVT